MNWENVRYCDTTLKAEAGRILHVVISEKILSRPLLDLQYRFVVSLFRRHIADFDVVIIRLLSLSEIV
jgi:hypothetical protein